jgi:hypothetical protein
MFHKFFKTIYFRPSGHLTKLTFFGKKAQKWKFLMMFLFKKTVSRVGATNSVMCVISDKKTHFHLSSRILKSL